MKQKWMAVILAGLLLLSTGCGKREVTPNIQTSNGGKEGIINLNAPLTDGNEDNNEENPETELPPDEEIVDNNEEDTESELPPDEETVDNNEEDTESELPPDEETVDNNEENPETELPPDEEIVDNNEEDTETELPSDEGTVDDNEENTETKNPSDEETNKDTSNSQDNSNTEETGESKQDGDTEARIDNPPVTDAPATTTPAPVEPSTPAAEPSAPATEPSAPAEEPSTQETDGVKSVTETVTSSTETEPPVEETPESSPAPEETPEEPQPEEESQPEEEPKPEEETSEDEPELPAEEPEFPEEELPSLADEPEKNKSPIAWGWIAATVVLLLLAAAECCYIFRDRLKIWKKKSPVKPAAEPAIATIMLEDEEMPPVEEPKKDEALSYLAVGKVHAQGARESQQDSFSVISEDPERGTLVVVADGMGGLKGGDQVSQAVVSAAVQSFYSCTRPAEETLPFLLQKSRQAVEELQASRQLGRSGSTVVMGLLRDKKFYYISVGDSRVCLYRDGALYQLNRTHSYLYELLRREINGELTAEELKAVQKTDGLTSYLGMGSLSGVDIPAAPIEAREGDRFVLMSDGVFNALSDQELCSILQEDAPSAAQKIDQQIREKNHPAQDNYTAVIVQCRPGFAEQGQGETPKR